MDVKEEKGQRAMSAARLDYYALSSDSIFLGKETAVDAADDHLHTIEVVRLLYGADPKPGERSVVGIMDHISIMNKVAEVRPEPMLYFVRFGSSFPQRKAYYVATRLPASCETEVVAALNRRDLYPIVDTTARGKRLRSREVGFRGSVDEAIAFLGSERIGAVKLAVQAISHQKEAACERLVVAIEQEMFREAEPARGEFRMLHNLVRLLGRLDGGASGSRVTRLLERELDHVESQLAAPISAERSPGTEYRNEDDDDAVNHVLAWLAIAIDEHVVGQRYGKRLIKLRDAAKGHWRAELQLALDLAHVEDNIELAELAPGEQDGVIRSPARIYHPSGAQAVAFSADGKFLATGGEWRDICIWSTGDWTSARMIEQEGQICCLGFSPDGKFLSATSADGNDLAEHRFEWRTGTAIARHEGGRERAADARRRTVVSSLTPNGEHRVIASLDYSKEHFLRLQVLRAPGVGQAVAEIRLPGVWDDTPTLAVSPDGGQVAIASGDVRLGVYSLPDLKTIREYWFPCQTTRSERVSQLAYSPDGRWLVAAQGRRPTPRFFRAETGEEVMPYVGHGDDPIDLRFLDDGKTLRSISADGTVCTWDAATLKMLRRSLLPAGRLAASVRPSDGRYVLCPLARDPKQPIQVVDVETGKVLCEVALPLTWGDLGVTEGVTAGVKRVYWLNDEEVLCTGYFIDPGAGARDQQWRFNYRTGTVLQEGAIDAESPNALLNGYGELTEDGRHLLVIEGIGKGRWGTLSRFCCGRGVFRGRTFCGDLVWGPAGIWVWQCG